MDLYSRLSERSRHPLCHNATRVTLWEIYEKAREPYLKPSSATELKRLWEKYIIPELGSTKALQLEQSAIRRFHEKNAYRSYSANRMLEAIRSAFNYAIDNELLKLQKNPCNGVKKYKERKRERFLNMEEVSRLSKTLRDAELQGTEQPGMIALIRLLLLTGCRLGEILSLKWEYVDTEQSCLRLPDSKTGAKVVYLSVPAMEILNRITPEENNPFVIIGSSPDGRMSPPQKAWRRIRKVAGLEKVRMHDLRHSFASVGAASNLALPIIGALLGHSQAQTTERYAHLVGK